MPKYLISAGLLCFITALLILVFYSKDSVVHVDELVHANCPLVSQSCHINLGKNFNLEISLSPNGFPAMEPLVLQLKSNHINFQKIKNFSALFEGRDMEMGKHSMILNSPVEVSTLLAKGMIPLCPMDPKMVWRLTIQFELQNKVTALEFEVPSNIHSNEG